VLNHGRHAAEADGAGCWQLTPGVGFLEGTLVGDGAHAGQHAYLLVLPDGRRFNVSRPLYHLARLLAGGASLATAAARLSESMARPIGEQEVEALISRRLAPLGLARRPTPDARSTRADDSA
jgi:hypothetical protein